jgi:hypothetical protein
MSSRKIKNIAKAFLRTASGSKKATYEETLFQGSTSSSSRRKQLMQQLAQDQPGRIVCFQRAEV